MSGKGAISHTNRNRIPSSIKTIFKVHPVAQNICHTKACFYVLYYFQNVFWNTPFFGNLDRNTKCSP